MEWKKYWLSAAGREKSIQMTEMRKGKRKGNSVENDVLDSTPPASTMPVCTSDVCLQCSALNES